MFDVWVAYHLAKIPSQRVEMQIVCADQMEIFRNKRTTLGGTPLFPFQPNGTEITVPFAQHFHFYCLPALKPISCTITTYHEIASFSPPRNKHFLLTRRRRGGLVVSALDFRSGGRWFEPGLCRRVVSLDKKLCSTLSLFT